MYKRQIQYRNVHGKEDTLVTIQIDMLLAERFGMYYTDTDGQKKLPYILHRTSLGCYERTLAYLIEKYAGALPTWMMPEQVRLMPMTDRTKEYAQAVAAELRNNGFRVSVDERNEKIGYKIREAQVEKIPYMLILGDKEAEANTVAVRNRKGKQDVMSLADFIAQLSEEVRTKAKPE